MIKAAMKHRCDEDPDEPEYLARINAKMIQRPTQEDFSSKHSPHQKYKAERDDGTVKP
jgi:hypothetical protein